MSEDKKIPEGNLTGEGEVPKDDLKPEIDTSYRPPICLPDRQANKSYPWRSAKQLKPSTINKSKGGKVDIFNKKRIPSGMNKEPKFKAEE
jgi:hypothetical protein